MIGARLCRSFIVNRLAVRMASFKRTYEEAVQKLNMLQSNKADIDQAYKDIANGKPCTNLHDMENYLSRTNISLSKLDELSVVHIAGTKGKGSTSAMCESILRQHGFRTGFYSSPHLVAVRERIRLNGCVISKEEFACHFHNVYDMLHQTQAYDGDMPKYFAFLTVLAFHVFLWERVDVAIVEVGIGGAVDYTNVLRKVPIVGITPLGLDHTSILGRTLSEIAAAKAGVMKRNCVAYTVPQPGEAALVLQKTADALQCPLHIVPDYESYTFPNDHKSCLSVNLPAYQENASLAIQLAHAWLRHKSNLHKEVFKERRLQNGLTKNLALRNEVNGNYSRIINEVSSFNKFVVNGNNRIIEWNDYNEIEVNGDNSVIKSNTHNGNIVNGDLKIEVPLITKIPIETARGIKECSWPGRYQVIQTEYAKFCLDGAHTKESMEICAKWFIDGNSGYQEKFLIFSATGDRDAEVLLTPLKDISFQKAFFVIPSANKKEDEKTDNYYRNQESVLLEKCHKHARIWKDLHKNTSFNQIYPLECVSDALDIIKKCDKLGNVSVLITGSLHLVGASLSLLDRNLCSD